MTGTDKAAVLEQYNHKKKGSEKMDKKKGMDARSAWAVGGGLLLGLGIGFFFLPESALAFVGSMLAGLGVGLLIASLISKDTG
jgi:hypothetical protein